MSVQATVQSPMTPRFGDWLGTLPGATNLCEVVIYLGRTASSSPADTDPTPFDENRSPVLGRLDDLAIAYTRAQDSRLVFARGTPDQFRGLGDLQGVDLIDLHSPVSQAIDDPDDVAAEADSSDDGPAADDLRRGHGSPSECPDGEFVSLLRRAMGRLGVSSLTLYVRDPWGGTGGFYLAAAPGVAYSETLAAGAFTPDAQNLVWKCGRDEEWFPDAEDAESLRNAPPLGDSNKRRPSILAEVVKRNKFFDRFYRREGVVSCARLLGRVNGQVEVSFFANFLQRTAFDAAMRKGLSDLRDAVTSRHDEILLLLPPPVYKHKFPQLLASIEALRVTCWDPSAANLHGYIQSVLQACLKVVDSGGAKGYATLHLYRGETGTLDLLCWASENEPARRRPSGDQQLLAEGSGVLTWVALRGQPLVLGRVGGSEFARGVYREIYPGVNSELAIPLFAGTRLLGVLNLESQALNAFDPQSVHFASYLGSLIVIACELARRGRTDAALSDFNEELELALREGGREGRHDRWARYVARKLEAIRCSVWEPMLGGGYARCGVSGRDGGRIEGTGPLVRAGGWTGYVAETGRPVWLVRTEVSGRFEPMWWDDHKRVWTPNPPTPWPAVPALANYDQIGHDVWCELGVPLSYKGARVGVAWVKYGRGRPLEGSRVFESWVDGDIRLIRYHLSQRLRPDADGESAPGGQAEVPPEEVMHMVTKLSEVPSAFADDPPPGS